MPCSLPNCAKKPLRPEPDEPGLRFPSPESGLRHAGSTAHEDLHILKALRASGICAETEQSCPGGADFSSDSGDNDGQAVNLATRSNGMGGDL